MSIYHKTIALLILVALLAHFANPLPAQAQLGAIFGFGACAVGGIISSQLSRIIDIGLGWIDGFVDDIIGRIIPSLGGILSVPANDQGTQRRVDNLFTKETVSDTMVRCFAEEILNALLKNITNSARTSGRDGGVAWIRNWRNFQLEAQYRGEGIFRGILAQTNLCNYFGNSVKSAFGATQRVPNLTLATQTRAGSLDSFALKAGCTMPTNFNFNSYLQNFSANGGWNAWNRLLEPQNNFYGVFFNSLDEAATQRALEEQADLNQAAANRGFLGRSGDDATTNCAVRDTGGNRKCLVYRDIRTPGGTIAASVDMSLQSELQRVLNADEIGEMLANMTSVLLSRIFNLASDEPDYTFFDDGSPTGVTPPPFPPPGGGGGGVCSDVGTGVYRYQGVLEEGIDIVNSENPDGVADELNTTEGSFAYLEAVAEVIRSRLGHNATINVLNGNDNPNRGDLIAIWREGEFVVERYDAVASTGAGDRPMREAATAGQPVGVIPLSECIF